MERYLRANLLGPGPRLLKKEFRGHGLTKVEKHCLRRFAELLNANRSSVRDVASKWTYV